jgi:hypothetical protein
MDNFFRGLEAAANIASVITALIAGSAGGWFLYQRRQKRLRLENHLRGTGDSNSYHLRPVIYLAAELGMTEAEIIDLAFRSRHIHRAVPPAFMGNTPQIALRYSKKPL